MSHTNGSRELERRTAIVTGGAAGIGEAIARSLVDRGAGVAILDVDDRRGRAVAESLGGEPTALSCACDVADDDSVRSAVVLATDRLGPIDIVVNNAAIALGGQPIHEFAPDAWERVIAVNLGSIYRTARHTIPGMIERGRGVIINIASTQAHIGFDGWAAYAAAKGGVVALTRQMANEYAPTGIRVNSVSPGTILTEMNERIVVEQGEEIMNSWLSLHPIGRLGLPEEVADAVVYLVSDRAGFITGIDLRVDGGQTISTKR